MLEFLVCAGQGLFFTRPTGELDQWKVGNTLRGCERLNQRRRLTPGLSKWARVKTLPVDTNQPFSLISQFRKYHCHLWSRLLITFFYFSPLSYPTHLFYHFIKHPLTKIPDIILNSSSQQTHNHKTSPISY